MLYDLDPHPDVKPDVWCTSPGEEIDVAFVGDLSDSCFKYITIKVVQL
jgi:hypothetical protein